jgi:hypothetical protein
MEEPWIPPPIIMRWEGGDIWRPAVGGDSSSRYANRDRGASRRWIAGLVILAQRRERGGKEEGRGRDEMRHSH